ncbi:MAG: type IX secretion system outer membrane channel protein PorV [Bacteroidales bacterium]|nr:type IX secretion system outer membrane channel protein PorV [Bacteroidales bacterium]MBN2757188.1 type IX secretion system outer membrane channel protein PorV [Bacteroidales bacterium]
MKKALIRFSFFILLIIPSLNLKSQITTGELSGEVNTITSAVPFLMITPDSRAGGMGDAGVATSPDAASLHWNAAKLSFIDEDYGASLSYTPWLRALIDDISLSYLSGFKKLKNGQVLGLSLRYFSLGNITFTDISGTTLRDFRPNEFSLSASYSMLFSKNLSGGIALKYIYSNLTGGIQSGNVETHPGNAVAGDISLYYTKAIKIAGNNSNMSFGINISNIGNKISYTDDSESNFLPTNLRLGGALTYEFDQYNALTYSMDINKLLIPTPPVYDGEGTAPENIVDGMDPDVSVPAGMWQSFYDAPGGTQEELRELTYSFGLEYWYDKKFALRTGYFHEHETKGNRKYATVGLGLKLNVFQLDFAYLLPVQQRNPLENTLRFSLLFNFKALKKVSSENNSEIKDK